MHKQLLRSWNSILKISFNNNKAYNVAWVSNPTWAIFVFTTFMAVTIYDVAKKAGVSPGTVSRYLNGYRLREKNRLRVEHVIKELGFKANIIATGLKRNRSMTIAVMIPEYTETFFMAVTTVLEQDLEKENYSLLLCDFEDDAQRLKEKLRFARDRFVDGLVMFPSIVGTAGIPMLKEYLNEHIPVVLIDQLIPGFETDSVVVDNAHASFRAVERLILDNHTKIAVIHGRKDSYVSQERLRGYYEAMHTYNLEIDPNWVTWGNFEETGGYTAVKDVCTCSNPPTAIYSTNYHVTLGTVIALHELHLRIPEDISLIGFDHFKPIDVIEPPLTVIEQPIEKIGHAAAELLLKRIQGDFADFSQTITLNTKMLIRTSVRKI